MKYKLNNTSAQIYFFPIYKKLTILFLPFTISLRNKVKCCSGELSETKFMESTAELLRISQCLKLKTLPILPLIFPILIQT